MTSDILSFALRAMLRMFYFVPDKIVDLRIAASRAAPSGNNLLRDDN